MPSYCFFSPDAEVLADKAGIKDKIEQHSEYEMKQTYVLHRPLSMENAEYEYADALVIFTSGEYPCFINVGDDPDKFNDYFDDFIDDISFLSEKFKYRGKIGRKKHWSALFKKSEAADFNYDALSICNPSDKRLAELISSLVIGSINDISRIDLEAQGVLDMVKSKIVLFDTDQTSFVFKSGAGKKLVIQGLAGSGKTELLLHKMKEIYSNDHEATIAFTCFNKILASSMRERIPVFFDFMRVERQIDWDNKLFCFHSWGSNRNPVSGMYRYICHYYNISFGSLQAGSFDFLCTKAINAIKANSEDHKYAFDYIFIDESQDFSDSFIELCELVTEKKVFVAGDVFQNIFRPIDTSVNRADLILKKCYRTDPKNLMFSHALGMGLFEKPVLRWLKEHEWDACGYNYAEESGKAIVKRDPLRRFEDLPANFECTKVHQVQNNENIAAALLSIIKGLQLRHPSICQGDVAVLFLDKGSYIYEVIPQLRDMIFQELGWDVNISFETKVSAPHKLFISNINNAKGLEFPFVICFALDLKRRPSFRNALYTMMARSFLESHLVLGSHANQELLENINNGLKSLNENNYMNLRIPPPAEIENQAALIVLDEQPTIEAYVLAYCDDKNSTPRLIAKLISRLNTIIGDDELDELYINSMLDIEYKRNLKL
jgi:superfamily I DNA and RNA helicase